MDQLPEWGVGAAQIYKKCADLCTTEAKRTAR